MNRSSNSKKPYHEAVASTLEAALCIMNYPSERMERHNKPILEEPIDSIPKFLRPEPLMVTRDPTQYVLIEPSVNCCRVSVVIRQCDEMEKLLCRRLTSFLSRRAAPFGILRREPIEGYDVTFLITQKHLLLPHLHKRRVIAFIVQFLDVVDREIKELKLQLNTRLRAASVAILNAQAAPKPTHIEVEGMIDD